MLSQLKSTTTKHRPLSTTILQQYPTNKHRSPSMKLPTQTTILASTVLLVTAVSAVDIGNFEEANCDWSELMISCPGQPVGVCCGFPQRLTETWSVGFRGLSEGDIMTWFHGTLVGKHRFLHTHLPTYWKDLLTSRVSGNVQHYCGNQRKNQIMAGNMGGVYCMNWNPNNNLPRESNDGANW